MIFAKLLSLCKFELIFQIITVIKCSYLLYNYLLLLLLVVVTEFEMSNIYESFRFMPVLDLHFTFTPLFYYYCFVVVVVVFFRTDLQPIFGMILMSRELLLY